MRWSHNTHRESLPQGERGYRLPPGVEVDRPKGTLAHTSEELAAMGMVGVYAGRGVAVRLLNQF